MPFCTDCEHRAARCMRRCERERLGEHLWNVIQEEIMRGRPKIEYAHLSFNRQASDVQRGFIIGAETFRNMAR